MEPTPISASDLGLPVMFPLPRRKDWSIGMVGFGGIARHAHAPAYRSAGWRIAAVADPDPAARRAAQHEFGIEKVYADYRELIADPDVQLVDLLTQPTLRLDVVAAAAAAGKPIITEKPIASSMEEALRMVETAETAGIPLAVHQNYRWMATNFLAFHLVRDGWIGEPYLVSLEIFGTQDLGLASHPHYSTCDDLLTLQWDIHLADLMRRWTGREGRRVFARTGRMAGQNVRSDGLICVLTDFGEGLTGHVLHNELLRSTLSGEPCRIEGSEGSILFDLWGSSILLESKRLGQGRRVLDLGKLNFLPSFAGSMGDFLIAIEEEREPEVSGRRNLPTLAAVLAAHRSALAGGEWFEVTVQPVEPDFGQT